MNVLVVYHHHHHHRFTFTWSFIITNTWLYVQQFVVIWQHHLLCNLVNDQQVMVVHHLHVVLYVELIEIDASPTKVRKQNILIYLN